ncbi:MAG: MBL fold metallo-hydrolase [Candidatus Heimdallarchaeaceae archaeon]
MKVKYYRIGTRGILFSFEEPYLTNVYVILGKKTVFVLDTFLGPEAMKIVKKVVKDYSSGQNKFVVFNSHADYDHFWGNQSFQDSDIYAHELAIERIQREGQNFLRLYEEHQQGKVSLVKPNITFTDQVHFVEEGVLFFYSPGHTQDSISAYDIIDKVLFVGDNIESPIPYINEANFSQYLSTLEDYLNFDAHYIISGHDSIMTDSFLIESNIQYLKKFAEFSISFQDLPTPKHEVTHWTNVVTLAQSLFQQRKKDLCSKMLNHADWFLSNVKNDNINVAAERERISSMLKILEKN